LTVSFQEQQVSRRKADNSTQQRIVCLGAYYFTIGFFLIAMVAPEGRVWGFNWWAYLSASWRIVLALLGLSAGPVLWRLAARIHRSETGEHDSGTNSSYLKLALPFALVFAALYLFFPSQTHFLGDGYQLLSRLADGLGSVKSWDIGASLLNDAVFSATSGSNTERALTTYRIISVVSGADNLPDYLGGIWCPDPRYSLCGRNFVIQEHRQTHPVHARRSDRWVCAHVLWVRGELCSSDSDVDPLLAARVAGAP
jgi:hypothetical protein